MALIEVGCLAISSDSKVARIFPNKIVKERGEERVAFD